MKYAILMPHGVDLLRCLERVRSAQNTEESSSCTLSTKNRTGQPWDKPGHDGVKKLGLVLASSFVVTFALLASAAPAHADLKLCNRMSYVVEAAIGIDDKAATATRGWFRIDPAACRVVAQGTLTADRILLNARALGVYGSP